MMNFEWIKPKSPNKNDINSLNKSINTPTFISKILINRGVTDFEKAKAYFRTDISEVHDPYLMLNMEKAVTLIEESILNKQRILFYGDYDVDGTTAVTVMVNYFKNLGIVPRYYIPNRYSEGYGISKKGVDLAIKNKIDLFISLDCGISAIDSIEKLQKNNINVIVCDHHLPSEILPNATILNPKQKNCKYPFKELSGCGVGIKLLQALAKKDIGEDQWINDQMDLLTISIGADMVPIIGENRYYCSIGLKQLENSINPGVRALLEVSNLKPPFSMQTIGFGIGPRINAAGRMDHAHKIIDLLTSFDEQILFDIAEDVNNDNITRKDLENQTTKEALSKLASLNEESTKFSAVVYNENWVKGVIGIVATKLQSHFFVPTVVITKDENGLCTGSARSVGEINLYNALSECKDLLIKFGGHAAAAGLTINEDNIIPFTKAFNHAVKKLSKESDFKPKLIIDNYITLDEITAPGIKILKQFEPCGIGNPTPIFATKNLKAQHINVVGKNHLKFSIFDPANPIISHQAIFFNSIDNYYNIQNKSFDLCYELGFNEWNGKKSIQLLVKDIKFN